MDFKILAYCINIDSLIDDLFYNQVFNNVKQYRKDKINLLERKEDKVRSLAAEFLLKKCLTKFGLDYSKEEIVVDENGKPYLKSNNAFFNLSHSRSKVFCVVSSCPVGCDVQYKKEVDINIARRFFTLSEYNEIVRQISIEGMKEYFYKIWCAKESFVKCTGLGLKQPFNSFEVNIDNDKVKMNKESTKKPYTFYEESIGEYQYCICLQSDESFINKITIEEL